GDDGIGNPKEKESRGLDGYIILVEVDGGGGGDDEAAISEAASAEPGQVIDEGLTNPPVWMLLEVVDENRIVGDVAMEGNAAEFEVDLATLEELEHKLDVAVPRELSESSVVVQPRVVQSEGLFGRLLAGIAQKASLGDVYSELARINTYPPAR